MSMSKFDSHPWTIPPALHVGWQSAAESLLWNPQDCTDWGEWWADGTGTGVWRCSIRCLEFTRAPWSILRFRDRCYYLNLKRIKLTQVVEGPCSRSRRGGSGGGWAHCLAPFPSVLFPPAAPLLTSIVRSPSRRNFSHLAGHHWVFLHPHFIKHCFPLASHSCKTDIKAHILYEETKIALD